MTVHCYRVVLETTNALHITAKVEGRYIDVEGGTVYMIAVDVVAVAREFPNALSIERVGLGYSKQEG